MAVQHLFTLALLTVDTRKGEYAVKQWPLEIEATSDLLLC